MKEAIEDIGQLMYSWATDLFPINRSLTGEGIRETLSYIKERFPTLDIQAVPTGTKAFDWEIPQEWAIRDAYIADSEGRRLVDFKVNNLHILGYSEPVNLEMDLEELQGYLYSSEQQPDAIPYVTSYYKKRWGFCLSHNQRKKLLPGRYKVVIDSELKDGVLNYGEIIIPGSSKNEILLSTYICHPSMANNELSGPVVAMALIKYLLDLKDRKYTYRIVFIPETIGAILYLSINGKQMKENTVAGFVLTCVGDDLAYSFMPSRKGDTIADRVARYVFEDKGLIYNEYSFLQRGSDERQYCSPLFDLPVVSLMRSKYGTYDEYHTSLDNLNFISPAGLQGGYEVNQKALEILENNAKYIASIPCEPKMDKRGLRGTLGGPKQLGHDVLNLMNFLAYADGETDLMEMSGYINLDFSSCLRIAGILQELDLIKKVG